MAMAAINSEGMRSLEIVGSSAEPWALVPDERRAATSSVGLVSFSELKGMARSPSARLKCRAGNHWQSEGPQLHSLHLESFALTGSSAVGMPFCKISRTPWENPRNAPGNHLFGPGISIAERLGTQPTRLDVSVSNHPRPQVLYVEDHPVNVQLMQALFAQMPSLELNIATTGEAGYKAAIKRPPALLLLDLNLPDCHGTQLLERLREQPGLSSVPAIAVTAADISNLHETTFLEVWQKPLDIPSILKRLDQLLLGPSSAFFADMPWGMNAKTMAGSTSAFAR
jgi:CheY-like chemotaxis protein